ncbi:MAG: phosphatase PAP2 family protein [Candidatus Aminicenantales bacterium]
MSATPADLARAEQTVKDLSVSRLRRAFLILMIVVLHLLCYGAVNRINSTRPEEAFVDWSTSMDAWIPYLPWTWVFYYLGDLYILGVGAVVVWVLPRRKFYRAFYAYGGMVIAGAALQLLFPGQAPWPEEMSHVQAGVHSFISMKPYACLPSMHVALTGLPAMMLFSITKSATLRTLSTGAALLITVSVVTMKEHYVLDAVTGVLLAVMFYALWRRR